MTFEIHLLSDGPIPEFWLTALANHDKISPYITERDNEVLAYLEVCLCPQTRVASVLSLYLG